MEAGKERRKHRHCHVQDRQPVGFAVRLRELGLGVLNYLERKGWEVGGRVKTKGAHVHLWLIHVDAWQKSNQYFKAIIFQLIINK